MIAKRIVANSDYTPVDSNNNYIDVNNKKIFTMIDNYIYLYHTETLIAIPTYPESISDQAPVSFSPTNILSRSAPIQSFSNSGPRTLAIELNLHRDMVNQINVGASSLNVPDLYKEDYLDIMIKQLYSAAFPKYISSEKLVDPPIAAIRFGRDIFCKGVVNNVSVTYNLPILRTDKYASVNVSFQITEIDPYDADTIAKVGGFRGLNENLERNIWKKR